MTARRLMLLAAAGVAAGCSDPSAPDPTPDSQVTAVAVATTNGQSATRGRVLPRTLQVRVTSGGSPVEGVRVAWRPFDGSVLSDTTVTGPDGIAATTWVLGSTPGAQTLEASVEGAGQGPIRFTATALPLVTMTPDPATDNQVGTAGSQIPAPLRVTVRSEGLAAAGIVVGWRAESPSRGALQYSTTGSDGMATFSTSLPSAAGEATFTAEVQGAENSPVLFRSHVLSGTPASITLSSGDSVVPVNRPVQTIWLWATVADQYGNPIAGAPVDWRVASGPFVVTSSESVTGVDGTARGQVAMTGSTGEGRFVVTTFGGLSREVSLRADPPIPTVILQVSYPTSQFMSAMNGTSPAVDTIPVGGTMTWYLSTEDLEAHAITAVDTPMFPVFPYVTLGYGGATHGATVTFPIAGTYHYTDDYWPGTIGTIVVQ